jgi:hypothetical protein
MLSTDKGSDCFKIQSGHGLRDEEKHVNSNVTLS